MLSLHTNAAALFSQNAVGNTRNALTSNSISEQRLMQAGTWAPGSSSSLSQLVNSLMQ